MNAADVMVSNVITVGPDATVQEVAGILLKNKILPDVKPDTDRRGCYPSVALPAGGIR
jgi:CBS domain-containing protein